MCFRQYISVRIVHQGTQRRAPPSCRDRTISQTMCTSDSAAPGTADIVPVVVRTNPRSDTEQLPFSGVLQPRDTVTPVKVVSALAEPHAKPALRWRAFQEFTLPVSGENGMCMVETLRCGKIYSACTC